MSYCHIFAKFLFIELETSKFESDWTNLIFLPYINPPKMQLFANLHSHTVSLIGFLTGEIGLDSHNVSFNLVF